MTRAGRRGVSLRLMAATWGIAVAFSLALVGCTAAPADVPQPDEPAATEPAPTDPTAPPPDTGAPKECAAAFPQAMGMPSLDDIEALPADWPDPPAGSTLCITMQGAGEKPLETLSYATTVSAEEVLAHYERLLTGYTLERELDVMITGYNDSVGFQIRAGAGTLLIGIKPTD